MQCFCAMWTRLLCCCGGSIHPTDGGCCPGGSETIRDVISDATPSEMSSGDEAKPRNLRRGVHAQSHPGEPSREGSYAGLRDRLERALDQPGIELVQSAQ